MKQSIVIETRLLHLVARLAERTQQPLRAKRLVDTLGHLLRPLDSREAMRDARKLEGSGTCLTRALTIAARLPGSEVVIGTNGLPASAFSAHAWVVHNGTMISVGEPAKHEITRL